ncbi:MAG: CPBP family intramembrane metalloprotease [Lachnospiraceae bacterium]|nr:CPBP family intramembrane metalloprotease [Lachnospiraceae bacterium]
MNLRNIKSLYKKELLDVMRDKKTVIMMVVVPIILYPLLIVLSLQVMSAITTQMTERTYIISVYYDEDDIMKDIIAKYDLSDYSLKLVSTDEPEKALADENIDAYIKITNTGGKENFEVYYISSVTNSGYAADRVSDLLSDYTKNLTKEKLELAGLDSEEILNPVDVTFEDTATNEETAGSLLSSILPFMLIVSLLMGTMYPAIDTTAGERERGTLETLLTLPVTNSEIIVSKFFVVATIGIISALLNIISISGVGVYMYNMTSAYTNASGGISLSKFAPAIIVGILCVFAFAIFISAITMCVTAFAKTYKEANNYITPLSLVVMFASFIGFIPNIKLNEKAALIPVANISLLIRDMLSFKYDAKVVLIVLLSNVFYGLAAIWFLGRIYNSEAILFGESAAGVQIFERRKNIKPGGVPELGDTVLVLFVTMFAMIYIGGAIQLKLGYFGVIGTQLLILVIPLLVALYTKKSLKKTYRINSCGIKHIIGGIIMMVGAIFIGVVLTSIVGALFPSSASEANELQNSLIGDNIISTLFVVAALPAICEEMMFRGYVLTAFEHKFKPKTAIFISACLFGIYHMSIVRFFATAFLGYVICYAAYKSKSIIPGMIMHFINNAVSVLSLYYPERFSRIFLSFIGEKVSLLDVFFFILMGLLLLYAGYMIVNIKAKRYTD